MDEINAIIESFKKCSTNRYPMEMESLKVALKIKVFIQNFETSENIEEDLDKFDIFFYGDIKTQWCNAFNFYNIDNSDENYYEIFKDLRFLSHKLITNKKKIET